jgi:hypothetical protein
MHRFEAYPSRWKLVAFLLLNIVFVTLGAIFTQHSNVVKQILGWIAIAFFGYGFYAIPRKLWQPRLPRIVIDDAGITTGTSAGVVEWADIEAFRVDAIRGTKFLSIDVVDPEKYLARMPPLARKSAQLNPRFGVSEIALSFVDLTPGLAEACDFLREQGFEVAGK